MTTSTELLLKVVKTELLLKVVKKEIDIMDLIKKELSNRGVDGNGKWIGFGKAKEFWNENEKVWDSHYKKWITIPEDSGGHQID